MKVELFEIKLPDFSKDKVVVMLTEKIVIYKTF